MTLAVVALVVSAASLSGSLWSLREARRSYLETHREYLKAVARSESRKPAAPPAGGSGVSMSKDGAR